LIWMRSPRPFVLPASDKHNYRQNRINSYSNPLCATPLITTLSANKNITTVIMSGLRFIGSSLS